MTRFDILNYAKELKLKHIVLIFTLFTFNLVYFLCINNLSNENDQYSYLINIGGRQRMLSQRILLKALEKTNNKDVSFQKELELFDNSHILLKEQSSLKAKSFYSDEVDKEILTFKSNLDNLNSKNSNRLFIHGKSQLLNTLNQAVSILESQSISIDKTTLIVNVLFLVMSFVFYTFIYFIYLNPLRLRIIELLNTFNHEKINAQKALEVKSMFLANMSHEIRTPLNGIVGITDIAMDKDIDPQSAEYFKDIKKAGESLSNIINDILDMSSLEAGKLRINQTDFSLRNLIMEIHSILGPKATTKGLDFNYKNLDLLPIVINSDLQRMKQILLNLVSNAIKYTKEGKVSIIARLDEKFIYIDVKDTGIGLSDEDIHKVFENFSQIENTYVKTQEGTGLGLSITKKIVDILGGHIIVDSTFGVGSCFTFKISKDIVKTEVSEVIEKKDNLEVINFEIHKKVLIAEDNLINQKVICRTLERFGIEYKITNNGLEALNEYNAEKYSFVLMDISMPIMDGFESATKILEKEPDALIFALSANVFTEDQQRAKNVGMKSFLTKPLNRNELILTLNQYFPKNQEHDENNSSQMA